MTDVSNYIRHLYKVDICDMLSCRVLESKANQPVLLHPLSLRVFRKLMFRCKFRPSKLVKARRSSFVEAHYMRATLKR